MAVKAVRASVAQTIVPIWGLPTAGGDVFLDGGRLDLEAGGDAATVLILTNGTAAAAGTLAYLVLKVGGTPLPGLLPMGAKGMVVNAPGGLGIKTVGATAGTITGYLTGVEHPRT